MLTRITRYTLLVLCLLVAGVWAASANRVIGVSCNGHSVCAINGTVLVYSLADHKPRFDWIYSTRPQTILWGVARSFRSPRITPLYDDSARVIEADVIELPLGWLTVIILAATALLWYRPIRNRLRGKRDAGFEVEAKPPEPVKE